MNKQGVTLLETIVVLAIAAIAASIAVPKFQQAANTKRADSAIESLRTISHCILLYQIEKGLTVFTDTPSPSPYNLPALEKLSTKTGGNGCFDFNALEPTYDFYLKPDVETWAEYGEEWANPVSLMACDKKSDRVIFLRFAGEPAANSFYVNTIYDFKDTACPDSQSTINVSSFPISKLIRQLQE